MDLIEKIDLAAKWIAESERLVIFTGAGCSTGSGLPDYRGPDGVWTRRDKGMPPPKSPPWDQVKPNLNHYLFVELLEMGKLDYLISQNIDGLHQRSGSTKVLELHGSIIRIKCSGCNFKDDIPSGFDELPPKCSSCNNILRPDVVWFGESLPQDVWNQAIFEAESCDVMIIAGTSLVVSPANTLPVYAKQNNALLVEINPEETIMSSEMDLSLKMTSAKALPNLITIFKN